MSCPASAITAPVHSALGIALFVESTEPAFQPALPAGLSIGSITGGCGILARGVPVIANLQQTHGAVLICISLEDS